MRKKSTYVKIEGTKILEVQKFVEFYGIFPKLLWKFPLIILVYKIKFFEKASFIKTDT